jgi:hypothetical protein
VKMEASFLLRNVLHAALTSAHSATRKLFLFISQLNWSNFLPQSVEDVEFDIILGVPIANCNPNATTPIDTTIREDLTIGESWSMGFDIGINLGSLRMHYSNGYSREKTVSASQAITIHVPPGNKVKWQIITSKMPY